jgi:hypothetical protein
MGVGVGVGGGDLNFFPALVGRKMPSSMCLCPNPQMCDYVILHGKRDFEDVFKFRRLPWIV